MSDDLAAAHAYLKLWAQRNRVDIVEDCEQEASDWEPEEDGGPFLSTVYIATQEGATTAENIAILAHELGHHVSWCELKTPFCRDVLERVREDRAPLEEVVSVVSEEEHAWAFARELVVEAGIRDLCPFEAQRIASLCSYHVKSIAAARRK